LNPDLKPWKINKSSLSNSIQSFIEADEKNFKNCISKSALILISRKDYDGTKIAGFHLVACLKPVWGGSF